jgi:hypothetical protein
MVPFGYILLAIGFAVGLYGEIRFLVAAYKRNLSWFFGCLFLPVVGWVFLALNLKATIKPFALSLVGLIVAGLGSRMAGIDWPT